MKKNICLIVILLFFWGCASFSLSSPENTVITFLSGIKNNDIIQVNKTLINKKIKKIADNEKWINYKILSKKVYDKDSVEEIKILLKKRHLIYETTSSPVEGDVEIQVKQYYYIDGYSKSLKTDLEYSYLLRKVTNDWFIIRYLGNAAD